jgi:predicted metal-dependent peptidase
MTNIDTILSDPTAYIADRLHAARRMLAAREDMLTLAPFWFDLSLRLAVVEDPTCRTGWTDGISIGYSPSYVNSITHDERVFLIAHEVAHCAFLHPYRRDGRDHFEFNVATDIAINSELARHGFKLPKSQSHESFRAGGEGVLLDPKFDGRGAEWIYDRTSTGSPELPDEPGPGEDAEDGDDEPGDDEPGDGEGEGDEDEGEDGTGTGEGDDGDEADAPDNSSTGDSEGGDDGEDDDGEGTGKGGKGEADTGRPELPGEVRDAPAPKADEPDMTEADWRRATVEAAMTAKVRGDTGGDIERVVNNATESKVDWIAVLRRFVQDIAEADYSWRRPNRRYAPMGIYLPDLVADGLGPMVVAIDTSGSVDDVQLSQMEAESRAIVSEADPVRTTVVYCDTRINAVETFERGEPVELTAKGGGGTDFAPVFAHVETMVERPACLVYLTDMQGRFPEVAPDYPVLWINTGSWDYEAPFGEVVRVR